jgi:hypothetical protein
MAKQQFKKGDIVTWTSSSNGRTYTKTGKVVACVPPKLWPDFFVPKKYSGVRLEFDDSLRDHISYLVLVKDGDRKPKLYRPLVSKLSLVK